MKRIVDKYGLQASAITTEQRAHPDSHEMEALMRRFNKDKMNGRFSLPDWVDELAPTASAI